MSNDPTASTGPSVDKRIAEQRKADKRVADKRDGVDDTEYVAMVTRDVNGDPVQKKGFKILLPEGASDEDKAAAWNLNGEQPPSGIVEYFKP